MQAAPRDCQLRATLSGQSTQPLDHPPNHDEKRDEWSKRLPLPGAMRIKGRRALQLREVPAQAYFV
jgi:hypothetical protein